MSEAFSTTLTSAISGFRGADAALAGLQRRQRLQRHTSSVLSQASILYPGQPLHEWTLETVHWTYVAEAVDFSANLPWCPRWKGVGGAARTHYDLTLCMHMFDLLALQTKVWAVEESRLRQPDPASRAALLIRRRRLSFQRPYLALPFGSFPNTQAHRHAGLQSAQELAAYFELLDCVRGSGRHRKQCRSTASPSGVVLQVWFTQDDNSGTTATGNFGRSRTNPAHITCIHWILSRQYDTTARPLAGSVDPRQLNNNKSTNTNYYN